MNNVKNMRHRSSIHFAILAVFAIAVTAFLVRAMTGLAAEIDSINDTFLSIPFTSASRSSDT
ncbi:MAG: hypothetical protein A3J10_00190 [Candidatus Sungbacteria bacterium RIFCSPLOWO2_02_FULL_54_10]|uniref:Uncharacterized protein n=1 Tax=Candidatus Sungbacteria bacterium RIFCSPHIGHO2_02_FULL_53_17 TaxID=1802275 RepID=A0A1G2KV54_9BACT|nr:MAG: hypothetical protein A2679_03690 [Candidatus Sungbacteria bacterium RIFCSPHIGHO2_01_FULL_54_26]OHA03044.1 MAG: hypothetical protein A3C92_00545 [Candidatus Sungbacteria bacterium RIFCSPHIGHO2_02_FULL_53_17]OHA12928.1 MAG: hypothetical protein A3J10_00190 [Candidatus Sungbacteria bacterium RIFCSPLOWO2_02_FULL_54_10]